MARNLVTTAIKLTKSTYYSNKIAECGTDQGKLYKIVHELLGTKLLNTKPTGQDDHILTGEFMHTFKEKVRVLRSEIPHIECSERFYLPYNTANTLWEFEGVSCEYVLSLLKACNKTHCASDPIDLKKVPPQVMELLAEFQTLIINIAFRDGKFPDSEKLAIICPRLKKFGLDENDLSNYRPVSLLSLLSKILERAILAQLQPLLSINNVLPHVQSGYRPHHSSETALCRVYNDLIISSCKGKQSLMVLLDLSSAFDTVEHSILLEDLNRCGLNGKAHDLLRSYLTGRHQCVQVGESFSSPEPMLWGVPQGSVLGPVLFSIYISPIVSIFQKHSVQYHLYADDMQVYFAFDSSDVNFDSKVDAIMREVKEFLDYRLLKLNESKTEILIIKGNRRSNIITQHCFDILGSPVESKTSVKNLGVIIDSDLNFKSHINSIVKKCSFHIRNLYAIKRFINRETLILLVNAQVLSRVDYCNALYVGQPDYLKKPRNKPLKI